jgi:hypothetical protein
MATCRISPEQSLTGPAPRPRTDSAAVSAESLDSLARNARQRQNLSACSLIDNSDQAELVSDDGGLGCNTAEGSILTTAEAEEGGCVGGESDDKAEEDEEEAGAAGLSQLEAYRQLGQVIPEIDRATDDELPRLQGAEDGSDDSESDEEAEDRRRSSSVEAAEARWELLMAHSQRLGPQQETSMDESCFTWIGSHRTVSYTPLKPPAVFIRVRIRVSGLGRVSIE